ncbi:DUF5452 domain-containing protein [[Mycoplasma] testudinis]|uniref:DUF5452 domain-containing protein n=1 Tax=[Mycoplasma] testudinis TaxID=33924 RepID=UPI0004862F3C|nr:DUF5452 domain-containing protein [[Mycoplasma] testudinis]
MTRKWRKITTIGISATLLGSTIALGISTIMLTNNKTEDQKQSSDNKNNNHSPEDLINEKEEYPETSKELRERIYPFGDDRSTKYMYANIHRYLFTQPQWDDLINYRNMMPDYEKRNDQFVIKQDVFFKNIRQWITQAIYQHPFFKTNKKQLILDLDYDINSPAKHILMNVLWWYENDYSFNHLPKKYWDQIKVVLVN